MYRDSNIENMKNKNILYCIKILQIEFQKFSLVLVFFYCCESLFNFTSLTYLDGQVRMLFILPIIQLNRNFLVYILLYSLVLKFYLVCRLPFKINIHNKSIQKKVCLYIYLCQQAYNYLMKINYLNVHRPSLNYHYLQSLIHYLISFSINATYSFAFELFDFNIKCPQMFSFWSLLYCLE